MKKKILMGIMAMTVLMTVTGCSVEAPTPASGGDEEILYQPEQPMEEREIEPEIDEDYLSGDEANKKEDTNVEESLSGAAFKLMAELKPGDDGNLLISPYSIDSAVGMTELGAGGATLQEMEEVVNGSADVLTMADYLGNIKESMDVQQDVEWNIANSIWMNQRDDVRLNEDFVQKAQSLYGAEVNVLPFNDGAKAQINGWVDTNTNHMIPKIINNIPPAAVSYLINAVAFEGKWENEYEDSEVLEDMDFTNADGSISKVTMLRSEEDCCFEYEGSLAFARPYVGGNYYFVGLVPGNDGYNTSDITVEEYITQMAGSEESFSEAFLNREYGEEVRVLIPEFEMDYEASLAETYMNMGMRTPFDKDDADFQAMFETDGANHQFWIDDIIHKTHIEVDREGTKAAAATAVVMLECAAAPSQEEPKEVILDRPFVYMIVDGDTGMPLFAGYINYL